MKRSFTQTLETLRHGELTGELDKHLRELVIACDGASKAGELTLKIKPTKSGAMEIIDDFSVKMPKADRSTTIMFPTVEGNLQRNDPAQGELDGIRVVEPDQRPVRSATPTN